jgi:tetratricopeptide (TPR) repeat protein
MIIRENPKKKKMMINKLYAGILLLAGILCYAQDLNYISEKISRGEYLSAKSDLSSIAFTSSYPDSLRSSAFELLGDLFSKYTGDLKESESFYKNALILNPDSDNLRSKYENIKRIISDSRQETLFLIKSLSEMEKSKDRSERLEFIDRLKNFANDHNNYYGIFEINYIIAREYTALEEYSTADQYYRRVLNERPAADMKIPVTTFMNWNSKMLFDNRLKFFSDISFFIVIVLLAALFFISKPWDIKSYKALAVFMGILFLWIFIYFLSYRYTHSFLKIDAVEISRESLVEMTKASLNSRFIKPGFKYISLLVNNCLMLLTGVYFLSLSLRKFKNRIVSTVSVVFFSLILSFSLISDYFFKTLNKSAAFYGESDSLSKLIRSKYLFTIDDIEAYVLVDPKKYYNISTHNITDKVLYNWILKHKEIEESKTGESDGKD